VTREQAMALALVQLEEHPERWVELCEQLKRAVITRAVNVAAPSETTRRAQYETGTALALAIPELAGWLVRPEARSLVQ